MAARGVFVLRTVDGVPVVQCAAEVDLTNINEMQDALGPALQADAQGIVVSLLETAYIDSQGVRVLFETGARLATGRRQFAIVAAASSTPRRILEIAGVDAMYPLFESIGDAVATVTSRNKA